VAPENAAKTFDPCVNPISEGQEREARFFPTKTVKQVREEESRMAYKVKVLRLWPYVSPKQKLNSGTRQSQDPQLTVCQLLDQPPYPDGGMVPPFITKGHVACRLSDAVPLQNKFVVCLQFFHHQDKRL